MVASFFSEQGLRSSQPTKRAPDAGESAHIPSLFHALAFFWLDGFAVHAPAQVTHAVGTPLANGSKKSSGLSTESTLTWEVYILVTT